MKLKKNEILITREEIVILEVIHKIGLMQAVLNQLNSKLDLKLGPEDLSNKKKIRFNFIGPDKDLLITYLPKLKKTKRRR